MHPVERVERIVDEKHLARALGQCRGIAIARGEVGAAQVPEARVPAGHARIGGGDRAQQEEPRARRHDRAGRRGMGAVPGAEEQHVVEAVEQRVRGKLVDIVVDGRTAEPGLAVRKNLQMRPVQRLGGGGAQPAAPTVGRGLVEALKGDEDAGPPDAQEREMPTVEAGRDHVMDIAFDPCAPEVDGPDRVAVPLGDGTLGLHVVSLKYAPPLKCGSAPGLQICPKRGEILPAPLALPSPSRDYVWWGRCASEIPVKHRECPATVRSGP